MVCLTLRFKKDSLLIAVRRNSLQTYDQFRNLKKEAFNTALPLMEQLGQYILDIAKDPSVAKKSEFISLIKATLWGNKCDLSLSCGEVKEYGTLLDLAAMDPYILSDNSDLIWQAVSDLNSASQTIDIILDNSGYELFTDLCLADYIISKNLAQSVRIYVKTIPWFISDVTANDFHWTLEKLQYSENPVLQELGIRWSDYVEKGAWSIVENGFWALPFDYSFMKKEDPNLYKELAEAKVAIFKGDLNYRKLFGEKNWDPTTPINDALQNFRPTALCILRTIKANIICGLKKGVAEEAEAQEPGWMTSGNWGLIQFSARID